MFLALEAATAPDDAVESCACCPGDGRGPMGGGGGGGTLSPKGLNKKESIEAFYKAQLLGFLQRQ